MELSLDCPICLTSIKYTDPHVKTKCNHEFCFDCYTAHQYSGNNFSNSCPLCRTQINPVMAGASATTPTTPTAMTASLSVDIQNRSLFTLLDLPINYDGDPAPNNDNGWDEFSYYRWSSGLPPPPSHPPPPPPTRQRRRRTLFSLLDIQADDQPVNQDDDMASFSYTHLSTEPTSPHVSPAAVAAPTTPPTPTTAALESIREDNDVSGTMSFDRILASDNIAAEIDRWQQQLANHFSRPDQSNS